MKPSLQILIFGMFILVQSCTGQKPAPIKNSTIPRQTIKVACSEMIFEGQVLSKKNLLNIFECSGWSKKFSSLNLTIKNADQNKIDNVLKVINDSFFISHKKRKAFFELVAQAQLNGELNQLAILLEKSLADHRIMFQLTQALESLSLDPDERAIFMQVLSPSNNENLKTIRAIKNIAKTYEKKKKQINELLSEEDKSNLVVRIGRMFEDLSNKMGPGNWDHLAKIIHNKDSVLQSWAQEGINGDLRVLLDILEEPDFFKDVSFLKKSIDNKIKCTNRANTTDFTVNVGQDLKHKIDALKFDSYESFESVLLHGMSKYLAFQGFCEEKDQQQGLDSFYKILKHAFMAITSHHDYTFLKNIHVIFGDNRFEFLSFLSSNSFGALREILLDLESRGNDTEFVKSLYEVVARLDKSDLEAISGLINDLQYNNSKTGQWFKSWSKLWQGLSAQQKDSFISFIGLLLSEEINTSQVMNFAENIMVSFPEFTPSMENSLRSEDFRKNLRYLIKTFSQENVQSDLTKFLSDEGIFQFVEILTRNSDLKKNAIQAPLMENSLPIMTYVETQDTKLNSKLTRVCFNSLAEAYEQDSSYYNLVNNLPESCLKVLGNVGFVGQIYLWMNASNKYFQDHYQVGDFHSATGVWSPGMLQFIFSSAVQANMILTSENGSKGIKNNLVEIHRVLTHPQLLETFHQFSGVYASVNQAISLESRLKFFFNNHNDEQLNQITSDGFTLIKKAKPYIQINPLFVSCEALRADIGANPCLSRQDLKVGTIQVLRIIKRKNENGKSLGGELIKWIHPQGGIDLPFKKSKKSNHKASIDEAIRFLYDLSSEKTAKEFLYHSDTGAKKVKGTTIDRLEVVIRDIAFINNFYGSYFKNAVAGADQYRQDVIAKENLLKMMQQSGGLFRGLHTFPRETKTKLKNVRNTYWSLVELSDEFDQANGTKQSYGPFIQSLLAAVGESSKLSTQDFNPYQIPKESIVEGHNGQFLTQVTRMSGLRHLSSFVRSHFDSELSELDTNDFKKINKNLIGRHEMSKLQNALQFVLDKYLDADRNQLNLLMSDLIDLAATANPEEQKYLEEIALKSILIFSDLKISNQNLEKIASLFELSIEMWPEIKMIMTKVEGKKELFKLVNKLLDSLIINQEALNRLVGELSNSGLIDLKDLKILLKNESFIERISLFINQLINMNHFETDLNWLETFQAIFSPGDTKWESLKAWFQSALGNSKDKLTVSLLIEFLGEKNVEGYRLKEMMDELFLNHREKLIQFLDESFKSLELNPDQNTSKR